MSVHLQTLRDRGTTLRQAALVAGLSLLVMSVAAPVAFFGIFPKLLVSGDIEATVRNIQDREGLFLLGSFCYLITFLCDVLAAWALYVFLAPVNRSLSLLTAWFRLVYTVIALVALMKLFTVFRLLKTPDFVPDQIDLLLTSFKYEWNIGMVPFGIYLGLLGYLVYRSGYIPRILGVLLAVNGLGYLIDCLRPYLYPDTNLGFIMVLFFGELVFMAWLLARGRRIQEVAAR
jgi:Domain of unknown function (DUF4386)